MKWRNFLLVSSALLAGLAGTAHGSGGPFGGSVLVMHTDPANASRLYATTTNGFFRSDDGGATWSAKESGINTPHSSNGVFTVAAASTLWLFDDAGRLYRSSDGGDAWTTTGYTAPSTALFGGINALAQGDGNKLWFAASGSGLLLSTDNGATFAPASGLAAGTFLTVSTDPSNRAHVIASGTSGCDGNGICPVFVSVNGGATWTQASLSGTIAAPGYMLTQHIAAVAYTTGAIYAIYNDHYYQVCGPTCQSQATVLRSTDNGLTWSGHTFTSAWPAASIATSGSAPNTVWVDGAKSIDGGSTFTPASTSGRTTNGVLVPSVRAMALSTAYPGTPRVWIGTAYAGLFTSANDGATWSATNEGLTASDIRSIVVHPADSSTVYAAYGDALDDASQALFKSGAGGTWSVANSDMNAYQLRSLLIDPNTASSVASTTMYAVGNGFDSSYGVYGQQIRNSGIYKSTNGGATWTSEHGGLPTTASGSVYAGFMRTIIADPRSCVGNGGPTGPTCASGALQTLYAVGSGRVNSAGPHLYRVIKSTDAGVTWADSSTGLPNDVLSDTDCSSDYVAGITPIVMDPNNSAVLYIGTFPDATDANCNEVMPHAASGVYKSVDSGAHWTWSSTGLRTYDGSLAGSTPGAAAVLDTLSLAIDPTNPQTLWVSTKDYNLNYGAPGELYKSTNGGASWTLSNAGVTGPDVRALLADAAHPGTVYAASGGVSAADPGGVFKSIDGGATWRSISVGLPAFSATALALDPNDASVLYAGTTGGVYSLVQSPDSDGDGVPDAVEDAGANGGDANHDGIPDRMQGNVATVPAGLAGTYGWQSGVANSAHRAAVAQTTTAAADFYVKTVASGSGIDCRQTVDATSIDATALNVDSVPHHGTYTYPNGVLHFELPQCAAADVDAVFTTANFGAGWSWRYYGPSTPGDASTLGWHDATSLVLSRVNGDWKIHLANGAFGSYRPAAANSILFEGGPAYNETIFNDNLEP